MKRKKKNIITYITVVVLILIIILTLIFYPVIKNNKYKKELQNNIIQNTDINNIKEVEKKNNYYIVKNNEEVIILDLNYDKKTSRKLEELYKSNLKIAYQRGEIYYEEKKRNKDDHGQHERRNGADQYRKYLLYRKPGAYADPAHNSWRL